ncbi:MAG: SPOR domain-containing protein, partial [Rhodoferax sp.]
MAFFKFRKGADEQIAPAAAPESALAMRTRARHRLIGAALLVLLGVVGFPMLFDSQPRPIAVDIPIEIPDKNKVKPLGNLPLEAAPAASAASAGGAPSSAVAVAPVIAPAPAASAAAAASAASAVVSVPVAKAASAPAKLPAPVADKASATSKPKADDGSKAQALLEGKAAQEAPTPSLRFVVQIGAFADAAKAHDARLKLEKAGLKTYTQVVEAKEGRRIRVRVGPFATRAEADKAVEKI